MAKSHSHEAIGYAQVIRQTMDHIGIPSEEAVVLSSGAMYLGAAAAGETCRTPNDIDISVPPQYLEYIQKRGFFNARPIHTPNGYYYAGAVDDWKVDIGTAYGDFSHDRLAAGAQEVTEGLRIASLNHVAEYKEQRGWPKDREDIAFIHYLFEQFRPSIGGLACTMEAVFGNTDATTQAGLVLPGTAYASLSQEEKDAVQSLGLEGQRRMGIRHGTGAPDFRFTEIHPDNRKILLYNTERHINEMAEDTSTLARTKGLGELACYGLWLGAKWHDIDQTNVITDPTNRDGGDELRSAYELIEEMRRAGIAKDVAMWAAYLIQGTQVYTEGSRVVGQAGAMLAPENFPTEEAMLAARIGASADLGRLYAGPYEVALGLLPQRLGYDNPYNFDLSDDGNRAEFRKFSVGQYGFLDGYRYCLDEAEALFGENRAQKVWIVEQLIAAVDQGYMPTTWQGLVEFTRELEGAYLAGQS